MDAVTKTCCIELGFNPRSVVGLFGAVVVGVFHHGIGCIHLGVSTADDRLGPELVFPKRDAWQWNVVPDRFA